MPEPFEDPRKTDMRARSEIAVDASGHELVNKPVSFAIGGDLKGAIKGDLQSLDGNEVRYVYYLRPEVKRPVPQWLVNLAAAAREQDHLKLYAVVTVVTEAFEKSCRAGRVALLRLTDENTFEMIVDADELDSAEIAAQLKAEIRTLRRRMEKKLALNQGSIESSYSKVNELTRGMEADARDNYINAVERAANRWDDWGARISSMLDEAAGTGDEGLIKTAERLIEEGAESD
jgi:hypothetical protein